MKLFALAVCALILGVSSLELTSGLSNFWSLVFVSPDYWGVLLLTGACLLGICLNTFRVLRSKSAQQMLLATAVVLTVVLSAVTPEPDLLPKTAAGLTILRSLLALLLASPFAILINQVVAGSPNRVSEKNESEETSGPKWEAIAVGLLLVVVVPFAYSQFLTQYYQTQLTESLRNGRIERARKMAADWSRLAPQEMWNDQSIVDVARQLEQEVESIQSQLASLTPGEMQAHPGAIAGMFLQLDQFAAATEVIHPLLQGPNASPFAWDTYGLILQRQERWPESEHAYEQALSLWEKTPSHSQQQAGLVSALRGIAHAQNRKGDVRGAEQTYLKLLQTDSSADNHFLLAQFYEEEQQTKQALAHANKAAMLAPALYAERSKTLIGKLESAHMGCFQVYRSEH